MQMIHSKYMDLALKQAEKALLENEVPVGCVVVHEGVIVAENHNRTNCNKNPLAHAEFLALQSIHKNIYSNTLTFYITVEPCVMCHGILERAGVQVYFGTFNPIFGTKKIINEDAGICLENYECVEILKKFYRSENMLAPEDKRIKKNDFVDI